MPPAQDLGQAVSSDSSYCTIILEYLVVRDINFISVKLRCLHPPFSLVAFVQDVGGNLSGLVYLDPRPRCSVWLPLSEGWGGGASCPGWFILPRAQGLGQAVSSVNSYCTIILEYLIVRNIKIISVKLRCLHPMSSLVTFVPSEGWGASCPGWFILPPPRPGFGSDSVISQFLLHHNLGIFSCKRYKHYFSQPEMFTSNVQFGYTCLWGWGASCPVWFILPHAQDLGKAVPSVNFYCTIILEY